MVCSWDTNIDPNAQRLRRRRYWMNKVTIKTAVRIQITCMAATYNLFPSLSRYFCGMIPDHPPRASRTPRRCVRHPWNAQRAMLAFGRWRRRCGHLGVGRRSTVSRHFTCCTLLLCDGLGRSRGGRQQLGELFVKTAEGSSTLHVHNAPVFPLWVDAQNRLWSGDGAGVICSWAWSAGRPELLTQRPTTLGKVRHLTEHPQGLLASGGSGEWTVLDDQGTPVMGPHAHAPKLLLGMPFGLQGRRPERRPRRAAQGSPSRKGMDELGRSSKCGVPSGGAPWSPVDRRS